METDLGMEEDLDEVAASHDKLRHEIDVIVAVAPCLGRGGWVGG